jgi:hypothetical protein
MNVNALFTMLTKGVDSLNLNLGSLKSLRLGTSFALTGFCFIKRQSLQPSEIQALMKAPLSNVWFVAIQPNDPVGKGRDGFNARIIALQRDVADDKLRLYRLVEDGMTKSTRSKKIA